MYIKGLLTKCEVCTGKYLLEVFVQCEKTELFQRTLPNRLIPFYFRLNQLRKFPAKTYRSSKKRTALSQRPGGQYAFFPDWPSYKYHVKSPKYVSGNSRHVF